MSNPNFCAIDHACRFDPYFYEDEAEETIVEAEWDEFCEDVVQTNFGGRLYEDMSHIYGRKEQ